MEINSNFTPIDVPPETIETEPAAGQGGQEGCPAQSVGVDPAGTSPVSAPPDDPFQVNLANLIRGRDLDDPAVLRETGHQVLRETLLSLFGDNFVDQADTNQMVDTFQDFIQQDPSLQEWFNNLLKNLR